MVNTNPFSSTTTGGAAGQFVYNELNKNQNYEYESISLSRAAKYEAEDQEKLNNYVVVLKALDEDILDRIQIINNKKQEIVSIIGNVFSANPNSVVSTVGSVTIPTAEGAEKVVYVAGMEQFVIDPGPPVIIQGVRTKIFPDILASWQYPNVETLNISSNFYKQGEGYVSVGSTNLGIGVTAYEFGDAAGSTGTNLGITSIGIVTTANASLGYYYFYNNLSSVDAGAAASISTLVTEIEALRVGISSDLNNAQDGTNKLRNLKSQTNIDLWFEKKGQTAAPLTDYQGGMDSLEENSTIIQDYNS